jgi:hypothetical protein
MLVKAEPSYRVVMRATRFVERYARTVPNGRAASEAVQKRTLPNSSNHLRSQQAAPARLLPDTEKTKLGVVPQWIGEIPHLCLNAHR